MRALLFIFLAFLSAVPAFAENYLLNGGQESQINYQMVQNVRPTPGTRSLMLSYVLPASFDSPTFRQKITDISLRFHPVPSDRIDRIDQRGNKVVEVTWKPPLEPVETTIRLTAINSVNLEGLQTKAPFPLTRLPAQAKLYLKPTKQIDVNNRMIQAKAHTLTASAKTEFDAVQKILTWVVDHMHYDLSPPSYDATYAFQSGRGNCQNYSHLAAAL
ncbi:transglutaminase family protein, partial [Thermodesulfobacteriota bacterium]